MSEDKRGRISVQALERPRAVASVRAQNAGHDLCCRFVEVGQVQRDRTYEAQVPISQLSRYFFCSAVRVSIEMPMVLSLRAATNSSTSLGTW